MEGQPAPQAPVGALRVQTEMEEGLGVMEVWEVAQETPGAAGPVGTQGPADEEVKAMETD